MIDREYFDVKVQRQVLEIRERIAFVPYVVPLYLSNATLIFVECLF